MRLKDYALLGLFCLVLFGYAWISGRALSMHESRLPQNARQMLAQGEWIFPQSGSRPWLERPPLPNWFVMIADAAFGKSDSVAVVRMPSAAMGIVVVLLVAWMGARWFGRGVGIVSGLVLATAYEFYKYSTLAEDDVYLAALVMIAMALFVKGQEREERRGIVGNRSWEVWAFFIVLGLSNLAKGPVLGTAEVGVSLGAFVLWNRDWKTIRKYLWVWGWVIFFIIAFAWPIAAHRRYPDVWENWLFDYGSKGEGGSDYRKPFWYFWVTMLWVMLPWTPAAIIGLWDSWKEAKKSDEGRWVSRLLACWALAPIVMWSIPARKHHHYLVPLLAPWAILAARGLVPIAKELMAGKGPAWLRSPWFGLIALGVPGAVALIVLRDKLPGPAPFVVMLAITWIACVLIWYMGGTLKKPWMMMGAVLLGLSVVYCWGQSYIPEAGDNALGDLAFLEKVREVAPANEPLIINAHVGTLEFFRNQFYLRGDAILIHNLSYLRDEKMTAPEVYLITRMRDAEKLAEFGEAEVVTQSEKGHREKNSSERFTLFKLRFKPGLVRYPAVPVGVMQAMERKDGPWLGPPM